MPLGVLQMVIEPPKQDLLWWEAQELVEGLVFFKQPVQFRVQLDINLAKQTPTDDLPDQAKNQVLPHFNDISTSNIHNRTTDTLCRVDNDVVVLSHVESIQLLQLLSNPVQYTLINGIWNTVVDELRENETIFTLVEHLERIRGEGKEAADIRVSRKDGVDVASEFCPLIFVDGVCYICGRALDLNLSTNAAL